MLKAKKYFLKQKKKRGKNMKLYFVTQNLEHDGLLTLRVPEAIRHDEEKTIKRIGVSSTLEGCFSAIPDGGMHMYKRFERNERFFKVFEIETEKYNLQKKDILEPEVLYKKEYVRDAMLTNEHWILKDIQVKQEDMSVIYLGEYEERDEDLYTYKFENEYLSSEKEEHEMLSTEELWELYLEENGLDEDFEIEIKCVLEDLEIINLNLEAGEEITFELFHDVFTEVLMDALRNRKEIESVENDICGMSFKTKEAIDISEIVRESKYQTIL